MPGQHQGIDMQIEGSISGAGTSRAATIAHLNDQLRKTGEGGTIMITQNLRRVTGFDAQVLARALATYEGFDADNDPHGEHDFGDLMLWGYDLLFKVDYFDKASEFGSDDPANPDLTHRVLTVMLAFDW
ncbi:MAG: DUF3768 domain-containing protein [Betaproteobacteria bacterium]|nr:DUF3768 domain-containing protein [Betaproteobacteria bacterium]